MKATDFPEATAKLLPPEGEEDKVYALPIWRHPEGGMVISKWKMTWRERLRILGKGHVWLHSWGNTHPPVTIETGYPFEAESVPYGKGIRRSIIFTVLLTLAVLVGTAVLYFNGDF